MGRVIVSGGCEMSVPVILQAKDLAVGTVVKLYETSTTTGKTELVDFIVVHQGRPSSLYDSSCDGTWVLRKELMEGRVWDSTNVNNYAGSEIARYLSNTYEGLLNSINYANTVKIPYGIGGNVSTVNSGTSGYTTRAFLLGGYELGWTTSDTDAGKMVVDGAKLDYFISGTGTAARNQRLANYQGNECSYWLRTCANNDDNLVFYTGGGYPYTYDASNPNYIRPALVLNKSVLFDPATLVIKGA